MSELKRASRRPVPPLDIDLSIEHGPVINPAFTKNRDKVILRSIRAIRERESERPNDVHIKLPLRARLETTSKDGLANEEITVEAQRDVRLQQKKLARPAFAREQYEVLKAKLWSRYSEKGIKVLAFVGANSGSGVSTTASNFAATLAQDARAKVLLIDANLRTSKNSNKRVAESESRPGAEIAGLLAEELSTGNVLSRFGNVSVLPSHTKCALPLTLFQSEAFDDFLKAVRERFDHVIIDAPPLKGFAESIVLSRKADGVILVIESGQTRRRVGLWAKQQIEEAGGKILGVVLNKRKFYIPNWLYRFT